MANKQTKRELKAQKRAVREAARRAERRRTMVTAGIVSMVVLVGAGLIVLTIMQERDALADQQREAAEAASEAARAASEEAEALADREVACGAEAPAAADEEKAPYDEPPRDVLTEGVDYLAVIDTSCGEVTIDLAEDRAPETVASFVYLARDGFFDGLQIFRNAPSIGALQTGAGTNEGSWSIGYQLPDELEAAEEDGYPPGAVAMANAGPNTSGSQFFFVYNDRFTLEPTYTRFATVTSGLDVLKRIGAIETMGPQGETPGEIVYMNSVKIKER